MPGFPPITDYWKYSEELNKDLSTLPISETMEKHICFPLPNFSGMNIYGTTILFVNRADMLDEFYVKKNKFYTKSWTEIGISLSLIKHGPFVQRSEDPNYSP